jgi:predicted  nucleic acid-binding Zn-ribbon protein
MSTLQTIDITRWSAEYSTEELTSFEREARGLEASLDALHEKIRELEAAAERMERRVSDICEIAAERVAEIKLDVAAEAGHTTSLFERPMPPWSREYEARCTCGWTGTPTNDRATAATHAATHIDAMV